MIKPKIKLSPRLRAILSFVEGHILADIGTDHGYLPIAACMEYLGLRAIACDLNAGPLKRAAENIKLHGLSDRIETRLGFGLDPILPEEADCVVIAGMGGMNIIEILKKRALPIKRLIVQPQHDLIAVRRALDDMGFYPIDEISVREGQRFYDIVSVKGR